MTITYRSHRNRIWKVIFDLGSDMENKLAALRYAWLYDASIVGEIEAVRSDER